MLETTRLGIEVKNLKMRVESMSSRLDFDERRARALEGVVQYRPGTVPPLQPPAAGRGGSGTVRRRGGRIGRPMPSGGARRRRRRGRRRPDQRPGGARAETARHGASGRRRGRTAASRRTAPRPAGRGGERPERTVKLAIVVQRYGADINGGAELHARYVAEHLARARRGRGR